MTAILLMLFCGGIETTLTWNVTIIVLFGRIISRLIPVIGFSLGLGTPSTRMLFGTNVVPEAIASSRRVFVIGIVPAFVTATVYVMI
ncbi:Uncharacterised protein [Streptococcus pneumoniae]|nr:Uncharacterised protein [Streptococcus pneumoniae]SMD62655.1 hypothetical protein BACERE00196_00305 [Bacillus cereus]